MLLQDLLHYSYVLFEKETAKLFTNRERELTFVIAITYFKTSRLYLFYIDDIMHFKI